MKITPPSSFSPLSTALSSVSLCPLISKDPRGLVTVRSQTTIVKMV